MELNDLKEYMGIVVDLEKSIFMQNNLINNLTNKISTLAIPKQFTMPVEPVALKNTNNIGCISIILIIASCFYVIKMELWWAALYIFFAISLVVSIFGGMCDVLKQNEKYTSEKRKYDNDFAEYQEKIQQDAERVNKEYKEKIFLEQNLHEITERRNQTQQVLERVYSLNIIYPKYRNLTMICSIYEYFISGRCSTLGENERTGSKGAYNILEEEIRLNRIIAGIDMVIKNLEAIKTSQYILYDAINQSNQRLNVINSGIEQLSGQLERYDATQERNSQSLEDYIQVLQRYSALNVYNTECIEKELNYMNRMNYFAGKYDEAGLLRTIPPRF